MYRVFKNIEDFNTFTENGQKLTSGDVYYIESEDKVVLQTNNIDGTEKTFDLIEPTGNIEITENGEDIDVAQYASATVAVPQPSGNISITENGTNIDVNDYATATVNVAPNLTTQNITENGTYQPSGNYDGFSSVTVAVPQPTGNIEITENGEGINIAQYATATVNVAGSGGNEDLINLIERDITTLNIPSGTTTIGNYAFYYCTSLTSVTIPNSVTSIGNEAFYNCTGLTSISIPDSVTSIGESAFKSCSNLTSITIPSGVTSIGQNVFQSCSRLTSITIPDSVTSIGRSAFSICTSLTNITIPSGVTSIGQMAFSSDKALRNMTILAQTPPTLGSSVFSNGADTNITFYVPAESVEAYKTATNWSTYASKIQAIPA